MLNNKELGVNKALLSFVLAGAKLLDSDPYFQSKLELPSNAILEPDSTFLLEEQLPFVKLGTSKFIFHLDRSTNVHQLCIFPFVTPKLLAIAHKKEHPGFSYCYEIISQS